MEESPEPWPLKCIDEGQAASHYDRPMQKWYAGPDGPQALLSSSMPTRVVPDGAGVLWA